MKKYVALFPIFACLTALALPQPWNQPSAGVVFVPQTYSNKITQYPSLQFLSMFDQTTGSIFRDYAGQAYYGSANNLTIGSGVTVGEASLFQGAGNTNKSSFFNGTLFSTMAIPNTNVFNMNWNSNFTVEWWFSSSNTQSGSAVKYPMLTKSNANSAIGLQFGLEYAPGSPSIISGLGMQFLMRDNAGNTIISVPNINISNNAVHMATLTYSGTGNQGTNVMFYLDGSLCWAGITLVGTLGNMQGNIDAIVGGQYNFYSTGTNQSLAILATNLTQMQIKSNYYAGLGQSISNNRIYTSRRELDASGNFMQFNTGYALWVASSNLYYYYSVLLTNDYQITSAQNPGLAGTWSQSNTIVLCYSSPDLTAGSFTLVGVAVNGVLDGLTNLTSLTQPSVTYNPISNYYVMGVSFSANNYQNEYCALYTNAQPTGRFHLAQATNLVGDFSLTADGSTMYQAGTGSGTPYIELLDSTGYNTLDSTKVTLPSFGSSGGVANWEATILCKFGGTNWLVAASSLEFYTLGGAYDVRYCTCNGNPLTATWSTPVTIYPANMNPYQQNPSQWQQLFNIVQLPDGNLLATGMSWWYSSLTNSAGIWNLVQVTGLTNLSINPAITSFVP